MTDKIDLYNAEHPIRRKAQRIMEYILEITDKPKLFDCKKDNPVWYQVEDFITEVIANKI